MLLIVKREKEKKVLTYHPLPVVINWSLTNVSSSNHDTAFVLNKSATSLLEGTIGLHSVCLLRYLKKYLEYYHET